MIIGVNTRVLLKSRMEGVCRYMHEVLSRMARNHPEDKFIFFFDRPYDSSFVYADNVHPVILSPPTRHPFLWYMWFEFRIPPALKKYNVDLFLSMDTYSSTRSKVPKVIVTHDLAYLHYPEHIPAITKMYYRRFFPRFHKGAHHVVCVSDFTRKDVIDQYNIQPSKVSVASNAATPGFGPSSKETIRKTQMEISEGDPYFCYLGAIHPRKNLLNLLEAFRLFKKSNPDTGHHLILMGRWAWKNDVLQKALIEHPYKKYIKHLTPSDSEVKKYLGASDALCYVSLFEGFGIPILEAFSSQVPVITSNVSSMPEVAGGAAILVDPTDPKSISNAMEMVLEPIKRDQLISKGRERLLNFNWDHTSEKIYNIIQSIKKNDTSSK